MKKCLLYVIMLLSDKGDVIMIAKKCVIWYYVIKW